MNTTAQALSRMTFRQKLSGVIAIPIVFVILWQAYTIFNRANKDMPESVQSTTMNQMSTATPGKPAGTTAGPTTPSQPGQPGAPQPVSMLNTNQTAIQNAADLMKLQQETQARYIAALNELQLLKLAKDIAEANQAIMAARLNTIVAQKRIVDTLAPAPTPFAATPITQAPQAAGGETTGTAAANQVSYSVVSVTQIHYKWTAVINSQGKLFNVSVGDVLPIDGSKVISINKTGVVLELNGQRKKYSLVPII